MVKVIAPLAAGPLPEQTVDLCEVEGTPFVRCRGDVGFELPVDAFLAFARTLAEARERLRTGSYRLVAQLFGQLHDQNVIYAVLGHDDAQTRFELLVHPGHAAKLDELWNRQPDGTVPALAAGGGAGSLALVVRTPGDGELPEGFAHAALAHRTPGRLFYGLAPRDAFLALLYRIVVDDAAMSVEGATALLGLAASAGIDFPLAYVDDVARHVALLRANGLEPVEPRPSVPLVEALDTLRSGRTAGGRTSRVHVLERDGSRFVRKQTTSAGAARGHALLERLSGTAFPRLLATSNGPGYSLFDLEHVDGYPLADIARFAGELSAGEAKEFVRACIELLAELGCAGVRHGDVEPANILVRDRRPVLVDFDECVEGELDGDVGALGTALAEVGALYPTLLHVVEAMSRPGATLDGPRSLLEAGEPDTAAVAESAAGAVGRLIAAGSLDLATQALGRALELAPRSAPLVAAAGTLALARGRMHEAAEAFERALALDAGCVDALKGLADLATDQGRVDEAADRYAAFATAPPVTIVIPVFNRLDLTRQCLEALRRTTDSDLYEVVVVDNASTDGTAEFLRCERAAGRLKAVVNDANLGFGRACNLAARLGRGEYVLFLNNDTIPQPGWLDALVATTADPAVGAVGSRLLYPDGTLQHAGIVFEDGKPEHVHRHRPAEFAPALERRDYPAVTGACILFRRELLERLGGFDQSYEMYVEDVDLCLQVWAAGYRVVYEPESVLFHLESASVTDLARRDVQVRAGWQIMRERWGGRWPANLPGGAPVPDSGPARLEGVRGFAVLAFADELVTDPGLLAAYAAVFAPADDATLVIYAPDGEEQALGEALAAAGVGEDRCPDLMAVSAPRSREAELRLAGAVDALFSARESTAPFAQLPRYDVESLSGLRARAAA